MAQAWSSGCLLEVLYDMEKLNEMIVKVAPVKNVEVAPVKNVGAPVLK